MILQVSSETLKIKYTFKLKQHGIFGLEGGGGCLQIKVHLF